MHKVCDGVRGGSIRGVWGGVKCYSEDRFIETQVFKFSGLKETVIGQDLNAMKKQK